MSENNYDFCILITTFNRQEMLKDLLTQINNEKRDYKIKIIVIDDGSTENYNLTKDVTYIKFYPNMGKKRFWKIINTSLKILKTIESKYYIYLQDDIKIETNFFNTLVNLYENINDNNKVALSFLTDQRTNKPNWTNFNPVDLGDIIKTQWIELHFICERKLFEILNYEIEPIPLSRWNSNPNLSSGVGWQISNRLNVKGLGMYHTKRTLVSHGDHVSQMNRDERKINKLVV